MPSKVEPVSLASTSGWPSRDGAQISARRPALGGCITSARSTRSAGLLEPRPRVSMRQDMFRCGHFAGGLSAIRLRLACYLGLKSSRPDQSEHPAKRGPDGVLPVDGAIRWSDLERFPDRG